MDATKSESLVRDTRISEFVRAAEASGSCKRPRRLASYFKYLVSPIEPVKRVLDIGGGAGTLSVFSSFWFDAEEVVCLEPGAAGSNDSMFRQFSALKDAAGLGDRVRMDDSTLQDFVAQEPFDLVILHNSVNHLDESAVFHLHEDATARARYAEHCNLVARMTTPGGSLIVADCSPRNLFASLGLHNPFAPTIDWDIHQPPELWANLFEEAGFSDPKIRWTGISRAGPLVSAMVRNRACAYCLNSHFALTMKKSS